MKQWRALIAVAVMLAGCQSLSDVRVDEVATQVAAPAVTQRLLVLGVDTAAEEQRLMEQALQRELGGTQRQVIVGSRWFSGRPLPALAQISARAREEGVTGILLTRLLQYRESAPPEASPAFSLQAPERQAGTRVGWEQDPGTTPFAGLDTRPAPRALLETRLYDAASGEVVWRAQTEVRWEREVARGFPGFAGVIARQLERSGWLKEPE